MNLGAPPPCCPPPGPAYPLGMATVSFTVTLYSADFERACAFARDALAELGRAIAAMYQSLARFVAALVRAFDVPFALLRRYTVLVIAVHEGWKGLALRHALRPPTRGYWVRRCVCQACGLRSFTQSRA